MKSAVVFCCALLAGVATLVPAAQLLWGNGTPVRILDVLYEPTPKKVVDAMLDLAGVNETDIVYDLGCGDGRIVIAAARRGAHGIGIDIDPQRIKEAKANADRADVNERVEFLEQDMFTADIAKATVVMLFLHPAVNLKLRPKLWSELKPGTRVVSHSHDMGDWKPEKTIRVEGKRVHYWTIPENAAERAKARAQ